MPHPILIRHITPSGPSPMWSKDPRQPIYKVIFDARLNSLFPHRQRIYGRRVIRDSIT